MSNKKQEAINFYLSHLQNEGLWGVGNGTYIKGKKNKNSVSNGGVAVECFACNDKDVASSILPSGSFKCLACGTATSFHGFLSALRDKGISIPKYEGQEFEKSVAIKDGQPANRIVEFVDMLANYRHYEGHLVSMSDLYERRGFNFDKIVMKFFKPVDCITRYEGLPSVNHRDFFYGYLLCGNNFAVGRRLFDNEKDVVKWKTAKRSAKKQLIGGDLIAKYNRKQLFVVEGMMDLLRFPCGFAVGLNGKTMSQSQLSELVSNASYYNVESVNVCLDADTDKEEREAVAKPLANYFQQVNIINIENLFADVKDIDEACVKYGTTDVYNALDLANSFATDNASSDSVNNRAARPTGDLDLSVFNEV